MTHHIPAMTTDQAKEILAAGTQWASTRSSAAHVPAIEELIPSVGRAKTVDLEVYRLFANCYYDVMNNGGGNLTYLRKSQLQLLMAMAEEYELPRALEAALELWRLTKDEREGDLLDDVVLLARLELAGDELIEMVAKSL